jgi:hypothetical protein
MCTTQEKDRDAAEGAGAFSYDIMSSPEEVERATVIQRRPSSEMAGIGQVIFSLLSALCSLRSALCSLLSAL